MKKGLNVYPFSPSKFYGVYDFTPEISFQFFKFYGLPVAPILTK